MPSAPKNSLQAVLKQHAAPVVEIMATPMPTAGEIARSIEATPAKFHRPSREGRRLIAGHFDPKVARQIKLLAAEEDTTVQALLEEALDLLFVKKGKGAIKRA